MRHIRLTITGLLIWGLGLPALAQHAPEEATSYTAEFSGIVGGGDHAPFWAVSNQYGKMPIEANNAYLDIGLSHHQRISKNWQWGAGLSLVGVVPRYRNVYLQQAYAEIGYQALWLSIGSKERYTSLRNRRLSSGDLTFSANARPIPEINLSIPTFTVVPGTRGWLQVKGDFAVGRSFDESYLEDFSKKGETYNERILWHHKSLFLRIKDTHDDFPLSLTLGLQHWAQWGGTSTDPSIGEQPHSFKDFLRVFTGSKGDQQASISDQENVLGSHSGSYDFQLSYSHPAWELTAYHQHPFNDKSGMVFENGIDGLWGIEWQPKNLPWLRAVVFEYLNTRDQSGPMHFIWFDHGKYPGVGGGRLLQQPGIQDRLRLFQSGHRLAPDHQSGIQRGWLIGIQEQPGKGLACGCGGLDLGHARLSDTLHGHERLGTAQRAIPREKKRNRQPHWADL